MNRLGFAPIEKQTIIDSIGEEGFDKALTIGTLEEVKPGHYNLSGSYRKEILESLTKGMDVSAYLGLIEMEKEISCQGWEFYQKKLNEILNSDTIFLLKRWKDDWDRYVILTLRNNTDNFLTDNNSFIRSPQFERLRRFRESVPVIEYLQDKIRGEREKPKQKHNSPGKAPQILFSSPEKADLLFEDLKGYFPGKEAELSRALQGEQLDNKLLFPHNQNKLVELFKRTRYNGHIVSEPGEIKNWLCSNFRFRYKRGNVEEIRDLNPDSVSDVLKPSAEKPPKQERICVSDWNPYKGPTQR